MKKILAAAGIGGALLGAGVITAGTASAYPPCQQNWALDATGKCAPIYSTTINGCDMRVGAPIEAQLKCWGDDWE
jgi:hypothetical protein